MVCFLCSRYIFIWTYIGQHLCWNVFATHTREAPYKWDVCANYPSIQEMHVYLYTFNILICSHSLSYFESVGEFCSPIYVHFRSSFKMIKCVLCTPPITIVRVIISFSTLNKQLPFIIKLRYLETFWGGCVSVDIYRIDTTQVWRMW